MEYVTGIVGWERDDRGRDATCLSKIDRGVILVGKILFRLS